MPRPAPGESTTDLAWDGHGMIYENGHLLAETQRFAPDEQVIVADIDLERLAQERVRMTSFNDAARELRDRVARDAPDRRCRSRCPRARIALARDVERFPYVPGDPAARDERCFEAYNIQVQGLQTRLASTGITKAVIGVSGGLDSTQALIVTVQAMDRLGLPRTNVLAYSMPGFATSEWTRTNALGLMRALGVTCGEIDIRPSCLQMLKDLQHPFASGERVYDVTFENVQAGERTSHLFRLANHHGGLVVGTGDLSELALGWCTYGVGDHMSHYSVNASVPKTLIEHLIRWTIRTRPVRQGDERGPAVDRRDGDLARARARRRSRRQAGTSHRGRRRPVRAAGLLPLLHQPLRLPSRAAWRSWPSTRGRTARGAPGQTSVPEAERNEYDRAAIKRNLAIFLRRFFETSQFKRSAIPNAPKVGSGGSLSPRSDWRAPSDGHADAWLDELTREVPTDGRRQRSSAELSRSTPQDRAAVPPIESGVQNQAPEPVNDGLVETKHDELVGIRLPGTRALLNG